MGSVIFEDFGATLSARPSTEQQSPDELVKIKRMSFDEGYSQGWNDAIASSEAENRKAQTDIAVALQETSFSYVEARMHVLKSVQPLLKAIVSVVLPEMANASLSGHISEELYKLTETLEEPIELVCSEQDFKEVKALVSASASFPVTVKAEPSFAPSQVIMKFKNGNAELDLEQSFKTVSDLINDFYETLKIEDGKNVRIG